MDDEYITREEAMWAACKALCHPGAFCPDSYCIEVRKVFNAIPAADVAPVRHGRWEFEYENLDDVEYCCTVCDWIGANANEYNYCPNCGAKMREVDDDN